MIHYLKSTVKELHMKCENCGKPMRSSSYCIMCLQQRPHEITLKVCRDCSFAQAELSRHRYRARKLGLPDTLTAREWVETKRHFHGRCAYCRSHAAIFLEHFVPLGLGGGTEKQNCIPACLSCNQKKKNLHPALVTNIPREDIERVRSYLMNLL